MTIKSKIVEISNKLRLTKEGENPFQKFSYFRPDDILKALTPLLSEYKMFMSFNLPYSYEKNMYEAVLYFEDLEDEKQNITYKFDIPLTKVAGASEAQGAGATMTYAKRYSLMNAFSIAENSDDLDAKDHSKTSPDAKNGVSGDFSNEKCPKCQSPMIYKEGTKNGKKWRGQFCINKKCKHVVWMPHTEVDEGAYQDKVQDQQQRWGSESKFQDIPKEYGG